MSSLLVREWEELLPYLDDHEYVADFREKLHIAVGRDYPYLCAELFALEGLMGWGPGFREYGGDFFPPEAAEARAAMEKFLSLLVDLPKDKRLVLLIRDALRNEEETRASRMLSRLLRARIALRDPLIVMLYSKMAWIHAPYALGGARIYLSLWAGQHKYALAAAGLVWLLNHPITSLWVRAETVRIKLRKKALLSVPEPSYASGEQLVISQSFQLVEEPAQVVQELLL